MRRSTLNLGFARMLFVFAGTLFWYPQLSHAEALKMAFAPDRFEWSANPGETLHGTVDFSNGSDALLVLHIEGIGFRPNGEEGKIAVDSTDAARSLAAWIAPGVSDLAVDPKSTAPIDFDLKVPPDASPGAHWGVLVFKNKTLYEPGAVILLNVRGQAPEKLTVASFTGTASATGTLAFVARLRNDGAFYEKPQSTITVRNIFGILAAEAPVPGQNVLPGYVRRFAVAVGNGFWPGAYFATITATYGSGGQSVSGRTTIWVMPNGAGWAVLAVIVALGLGGLIVARRRASRTPGVH
jgi:hypothetical protein